MLKVPAKISEGEAVSCLALGKNVGLGDTDLLDDRRELLV
jgi:hypothetical protein